MEKYLPAISLIVSHEDQYVRLLQKSYLFCVNTKLSVWLTKLHRYEMPALRVMKAKFLQTCRIESFLNAGL